MILDKISLVFSHFFMNPLVKSSRTNISITLLKMYLFMMCSFFVIIAYCLNRIIFSGLFTVLIGLGFLALILILFVDLILTSLLPFEKAKTSMYNNLLLERSLRYLATFVITYIITILILKNIEGFTSATSALYMISALVQSEAAIIAIVITLSLVAIQHLSETYSSRVIEIFKDWRINPDFYILLYAYILSIIFGLFIIKQIEATNSFPDPVSGNIETQLRIAYALGIFCLFSLSIYIKRTLSLFNPYLILELLSEKIDHPTAVDSAYENILNKIENKHILDSSKNPIHAILDILKSSARNSDFETTKHGLRLLQKKTENIINNKQIDNFKKELYLWDIFENVEYIGIISTKKGSEEVTKLICNLLGENGRYSIDSHSKILTISSLEKIGVLAAKNNLDEALEVVLDYLEYYIRKYGEYELKPDNGIINLSDLFRSCGNIGNESAEQGMKDACIRISSVFLDIVELSQKNDYKGYIISPILPFRKYGDLLVKNKLDAAAFTFIGNLGSIANIAIRNNDKIVFETINMIKDLAGKSSTDSNMVSSTVISTEVLENIAMLIFANYKDDYKPLLTTIIESIHSSEINIKNQEQISIELVSDFSIKSLEKIGNKCIHKDLNLEAFKSVYALSNIAMYLLDFDLTQFDKIKLKSILFSMCSISETSINNNKYNITRDVALRIYMIGEKASTRDKYTITAEAINCLDEIYRSLMQDSVQYVSNDWGELHLDKNSDLKHAILQQIETLKKSIK